MMLLTRELLAIAPGPPPQAVLDKLGYWRFFLVLLLVTCTLRAICLDVPGCLLDVIMLAFAWLVLRNNMAELARYALVYGILSVLNLIFDALPLANSLSGRSETEVTDFVTESPTSESYTVYTQTHAFFDQQQGIRYNAQSAAMLLSPCAMLLGAYLAINAHTEIQRLVRSDSFDGESDRSTEEARGAPPANPGAMQSAMLAAAYGTLGQQQSVRGSTSNEQQQDSRAARSFQQFIGTAHKLDD